MKDRLIHILLSIIVFVYIIFEELFWETIARPIYDYLHSLRLLQKIENVIHTFPPWVLLGIFLLIFIQVELLGFIAGALLIDGKVVLAISLYLGKIPLSAFAFWLFRVSKDKLMMFGWFKTSYDFIMDKVAWIKNRPIYQNIKYKAAKLKATITYWKVQYLPKGKLRKKFKRIYLHIKKLFSKGTL